MHQLKRTLEDLRAQKLFRSLPPPSKVERSLDFSHNDYLGLSRSPAIRAKLIEALQSNCPLGSTGSRLLGGNSIIHEETENFLAKTFQAPTALLFSAGFLANMAVLSSFSGEGTEIFSDALNHASLIDGIRLSGAKKSIFRHNDMDHLQTLLRLSTAQRKVIVTESVFSMDGDLAPLVELLELQKKFEAWLVVDEAHATGVFKELGLGCFEGSKVDHSQLIVVHTAGKALGGQGAFVLCSNEFRDWIINRGRSFIYNTALAPISALQIQFAVQHILENPELVKTLQNIIKNFCQELRSFITVPEEHSASIIPIILGSNERALRASSLLQEVGITVRPIRSPTVPIGTERLRISLSALHTSAEITFLIENLRKVVNA